MAVKRNSTPLVLVVVGLIILLLVSFLWWRVVYSDPSQVFERMLANTLATPGIQKQVLQGTTDNGLLQNINVNTAPAHNTTSYSTLSRGSGTTVKTEGIGTQDADYLRYTSIETEQKAQNGGSLDFDKVLNVWGITTTDDVEFGGPQLYGQAVFGVVPIGNLPADKRQELVRQILNDKVYSYDANKVKRETQNGRLVYTYNVSVPPVGYIKMLKTFGSMVGLKQLEQIDPNQYQQSQPISFDISVDVWSGTLTKVVYVSNQGQSEMYGGYGVTKDVEIPSQTVPLSELQTKLQAVQ